MVSRHMDNVDVARELRVMHACERGAVGVYRGHKCVSRYFFRATLEQLDAMRSHERGHAEIFAQVLADRGWRRCYLSGLWFYGVAVGMLGLKAIGTSTAVIEGIVDHELEMSLARLSGETEICRILREVQVEERAHRSCGEHFADGAISDRPLPGRMARVGAYTAMRIAERM
jgi:ubiquinone biosynthesis monooxygenase Coq7